MFPRSHPSPVAGQLSTSSQSTPPTPTTHLHLDLIQACAATKASNIVPPSPRTRHTIGVPSMDTRSPSTAPTPTSASALMNGSNRIGMNGPPPPPPPIPATTPRGQPIPTLGINSHHRRQLSHARIPPPPPPPPLKMPPSIPVSSPSLVAASPRHSSSFQFPSPASLLSSPNTAPSPRHGRKPSDISIPPTPSSASRIKSPPSLTIDHTRSPSQMGTIKILPPPLPANLTTVPPTPSSKLPPPLPRATCGSDPLPPPTPSSASISSIASTSQPPAQTPRKLPPPLPRAIGGSDPSPPASMASSNEAKAMAATRVKIEGEILSTEATYLANLNHLVSEFIVPLRTRIMSGKREDSMGDLDEDGVNRISLNGNLETLTNFHSLFFQELSTEYQRALNNPLGIPPNLARIFIKFADYFKMYTAYLNSYEACVCEMEDLRENDKFQKFVREFMLKTRRSSAFVVPPTPKGVTSPTQQPTINGACPPTPSGGNGLPVTGANLAPMDYFIQPVQRLLRYALLLQQLLKHSPPSDVPTIQQALTSMETIANFVNERKRSVEAMNKILQISSQISGELPQEVKPLIQPFRKLLKEGPLQIITENKIMGIGLGSVRASSSIVRLFTDLILWTNSNNKYKGYLDLNTAGVIRSDQDELIFQVSDCKTSIWCRGSNLEETRAWRDLFESTITQLQQEKDAARRRQRVAKARSNNHTHRLKLGTLIKEKLGEIPGASNMLSKTVLDLSSDLRSNDSEAASMIESDPQLQSGWLEKEAAAEAKRQREKLQSTQTSTGTVQPPMMSVFGTMPKEVIAQLKLQQLKLDPSGSGGSGGSSSTCTTVTGSLASSAQSSRRTSSNSANDNSNLKPMLMSTPSTDSIPSSTDCPSSTSSRSHSPSHTRTSTNNSTSAISSATFHQHSPSTVEEDEDRDITGNSTDQS